MANTINFILTTAANELIPKILGGKTLNFTRIAVGDGFSYDDTIAKGFKSLVNEVLSVDITKKEILSTSSVRITSAFTSSDVQKEFYYREVGLFAQDPDTGQEVLYAYGNRNDAAELITPTGSNVVTKKLIFVIAVGDSANVTFNVNEDVYALQSDMLEVQENLKQFETSKANKNLSNTGMITNCLLEVPQRIKYELVDGNLTIKAGTVVIVPYGVEDLTQNYPIGSTFLNENFKVYDTQFADSKFFVWAELQNDVVLYTYGEVTENAMVFIKPSDNQVTNWGEQVTSSGITPGAGELFFYNTETNFLSAYSNGTSYNSRFSLPIFHISKNTGVITSINQVFNGIGYIGSTVWVDKGVKGLIPNGRNTDGTLKNVELEVDKLSIKDFFITNVHTFGIGADLKINVFARTYDGPTVDYVYFDETENFIYASLNIYEGLFLGEVIGTSGPITSFEPKKTTRITDYNDYSKKIKEIETRISILETNLNI